jgi:uncharacterized protein (TIGR03790 family)
MNKFRLSLILFLLSAGSMFAQNYDDVVVIVNSNSSLSVAVGSYFATQRGIQSSHVLSIAMPTTEEIDSLQYVAILAAIKSQLNANGLTTSTNYIVTTQGVPLKVRRSGSIFASTATSSSFDSDLCLLNSSLDKQLGKAGYVTNPYRYSTARFSRSSAFSNIYLVTRLAGYDYNDIVGLIDRAHQPYHSSGCFVLDQDPSKGLGHSLNVAMYYAADTLRARGFNVIDNTTSEFVTGQSNVLGYVSWGSNDSYWSSYSWKAQPRNSWSPKALAETYVSTSGRSFSDSTYVDSFIGWQSLVADLIHENGVTGVKGYVYEPFTIAMAKVDYLFRRWTSGYNLAESYYCASTTLSWMDVVIGDPKSEFAADGHLPVELVNFSGSWLHSSIRLEWKTATEVDNYGFEIERRNGDTWEYAGFVEGHGTVNTPQHYSFTDLAPLEAPEYRLKQLDRDGDYTYSAVLQVRRAEPKQFALSQNYPNPCNGSTSIPYLLKEACAVTLEIYQPDGRLVATLERGEQRQAGYHVAVWDSRGQDGTDLPSGNYYYRISMQSPGGGTTLAQSRQRTILR